MQKWPTEKCSLYLNFLNLFHSQISSVKPKYKIILIILALKMTMVYYLHFQVSGTIKVILEATRPAVAHYLHQDIHVFQFSKQVFKLMCVIDLLFGLVLSATLPV